MRDYELVYIVRPDMEDEEREKVISKVDQLVANTGGQVNKVERWGKRRLAYPIGKLREGFYVLSHVQLEPQMVKEVERNLDLAEEIIRYLIVLI